jgi:zinc protease
MFKNFSAKAALCCFLLTAFLGNFAAQAQDLNSKLPVDPLVTKGTLSNGLTYYIRPNSKPEKKVELRLIVNAGSILEDDDQQGLAHFMEHMNFNGTKNYPKNKLVDFLQTIGVKFGADLNAYTSFDETVFILPIPTDKPGNLEDGFQVISDWAHNALLTDEDIDGERKVVLEESRLGKGAQDRMMHQYLPKLLAGSHYANRLPIGKDDILKTFKYDAVRRFYHDWYRPNLMAVAVVGDITTAQAKTLIEKYFGSFKNPANEKPRKTFDVPPYPESEAMVVTDKEATNYQVQLIFSAKKQEPQVTLNDYRKSLVRNMFTSILNQRFQELTQSATPPFAFAVGFIDSWARGYESMGLMAIPSDNIQASVKALTGEVVRAEKFGFNENELELAKKRMMSSMEKTYNERNTTESGRLVGEYIRNFLTQEPIPGLENENKYFKEMLPGITLAEVNAVAKEWLNYSDENYFALVTGPDSKQMKVPTDMELLAEVKAGLSQTVTAKEEAKVAANLLDKAPTPGKIVSESSDKELGITTYTLSNGVQVTVKPTTFKSDEILMSGIKKGGESNYGPADKSNTKFGTSVMSAMGYGNFTPTDLKNFMAGKTLSLHNSFDELSSSISGSSSISDFETLLQYNYLMLTSPRRDDDLYKGYLSKQKAQLMFLSQNPTYAFIDTLFKSVYNNDPRAPIVIPTAADFDKINLDRVLEIYKNELGNAQGFHYFIVGNVDLNTIKPLIEKYIGSLPASGNAPAIKDNGLRPVTGNHRLDIHKGSEPKSMIFGEYYGTAPYSEAMAMKADMLAEVLNIIVVQEMREKMGAIYGGGFYASVERDPYAHYSIIMQLPCGPESVAPLLTEADKEIKGLKQNGVDAINLDKVKKAKHEEHRESLKKNDYWMGKLENIVFWNYDKKRFLDFDKVVDGITAPEMKEAANKLFDGKNSYIGVLYPEEGATTTDKK